MIDAVSSVSSVPALQSVRKAAGLDEVFRIPESALRANDAAAAQGVAERDPVADSVELSRDFPQIFANIAAVYGPPPADRLFGLSGGGAQELEEEDTPGRSPGSEELSADAEDPEGGDVDEAAKPGEEKSASGEKLDEDQQRQVQDLKARDREVRAHEQAHKSVGGSYAGAVSYEFQQGPDGVKYAVGGEVSIDVSAEKEPESTIAKMQQVKAAAMAPAEPSGQDRAVAAEASQTEGQARQELSEQQRTESAEGAGETNSEGADETNAEGASETNAEGASETNAEGAGETDGGDANKTEGAVGAAASGGGAAAAPGASNAPAGSGAEGSNRTDAPASGGAAGSDSANPFLSRYAESAYGAQSFAAATMSINTYRPINIVA